MVYRNTKSNLLSKKEKDEVEEALISGIHTRKEWFSLKDVLKHCREREQEGYLGEFGVPFARLIPYLKGLMPKDRKEDKKEAETPL